MVTDAFCHFIPKEAIRAYVGMRVPARMNFLDVAISEAGSHLADDDARVAYMDKFGIDTEVLSFSQVGDLWQTLTDGEKLRFTRVVNDSMARVAQRHKGRLVALATFSLLEGEALDELDRAVGDLGLKGCMIYSNINGKPLDSPEFMPFYQRMAKHGVPLFIHPTNSPYYDWINEYQLGQVFGWPFDTSLAVGRLVFGGVLEKFPDLKIIVHHMGAMIPFFAKRLDSFYEEAMSDPEMFGRAYQNRPALKSPPSQYLKRLYGDTVVNGSAAALKCGYEFFSAEHTVFATDYPFGPGRGIKWTQQTLEIIRSSGFSQDEMAKILEGNIRQLLKIS